MAREESKRNMVFFLDNDVELVDKLIGKLKEGKDLKKRYLQMLLSSSVEVNKE